MNNTMKYKGFSALIEYSDEDKCFVGKIINIDAFVSFHGDSVDELRKYFEEAVDDYIDYLEESKSSKSNKKEIEKTSQIGTKSGETRATFIMSEDQLEKVKAIAYWERTTIKEVISDAIENLLVKKKKLLSSNIIRLSKEDQKKFLEALSNPRGPNEELKKLAKRHQKEVNSK